MRRTDVAKTLTLFAKLSLDYADHPKIQALSDTAFRLHVELMLYCRKYLTDGRVPNRVANRMGSEAVSELMTNSGDNPSLTQNSDGSYQLYGYSDNQETKADVDARRLVNGQNGRRGGRPGKQTETQSVTESLPQSVIKRGSEKKAETETETETETEHIGTSAEAEVQKPSTRGTRLREGWKPEVVGATEKLHANLDASWITDQLERFHDHWAAESTAKAVKRDWEAAWRTWLKNAIKWDAPRQDNVNAGMNGRPMSAARAARHPDVKIEMMIQRLKAKRANAAAEMEGEQEVADELAAELVALGVAAA